MYGSGFFYESGPRIRMRLGESEGKITILVQAQVFCPLYAVYAPAAPPSSSPAPPSARPRDQRDPSDTHTDKLWNQCLLFILLVRLRRYRQASANTNANMCICTCAPPAA
ncbi:hypothetical protein FIBSPDRAFT_862116 [Athelia psychrophila]|uniref:Uncharacterized protein n=1 Tax=Athelia psychrophila TaxID=1759441 RepID=A0A166IS03_9AGAM|nr:hypothetical protein FIBSPDRAFT_863416 [Fibularhizoctonia sp. CBS 109695]KZP20109.1 hypothetical protein FIBSPDRAFT_862116 [Fibularhizoctonia sp. CBS 109695]